MSIKSIFAGLGLATAIASTASAQECLESYTFAIQNGEITSDVSIMDRKTAQHSVYVKDIAMNAIMIGEQSFGEWSQPIVEQMKLIEEKHGLSVQIMSHDQGPLISDMLRAHMTAESLAKVYAGHAANALKNRDEHSLDDFLKFSEIAKDFKILGEQVSGFDLALEMNGLNVQQDINPSYTISGHASGCLVKPLRNKL